MNGHMPLPDTVADCDTLPNGLAASRGLLERFSIEVMPRTASKIRNFSDLLPGNTTIYIAHIDGTRFDDMISTAVRLRAEGFCIMPHITARTVRDADHLDTIVKRYRYEADVDRALLLAGGLDRPVGEYHSSVQLLRTGIFDQCGFTDLHVAGHPEGNVDIDRKGQTINVDAALLEKQSLSKVTDVQMAVVTQFAFASAPVVDWLERIRNLGITMPVHIGLAGPTKLQTLIKFAVSCGVGSSIRVLQRQARNVSKLLQPFEPNELIAEFENIRIDRPELLIDGLHFYPLGGIKANAEYVTRLSVRNTSG